MHGLACTAILDRPRPNQPSADGVAVATAAAFRVSFHQWPLFVVPGCRQIQLPMLSTKEDPCDPKGPRSVIPA